MSQKKQVEEAYLYIRSSEAPNLLQVFREKMTYDVAD